MTSSTIMERRKRRIMGNSNYEKGAKHKEKALKPARINCGFARNSAAFAEIIRQQGYEPVFKDWDNALQLKNEPRPF